MKMDIMQYPMVVAHLKYSLSRYGNTKCDLGLVFNWRNFWAGQLVSFKIPILSARIFEVR